MRNALIRSTGSYAPTQVLRNPYFDKLLGEDVGTWLETNLKIKERRWCSEQESTADLCVEAGRRALQNAGLEASNLDLIIIGTDTPEHISPSTASAVQYRLEATNAGVYLRMLWISRVLLCTWRSRSLEYRLSSSLACFNASSARLRSVTSIETASVRII